MGLSRNTSNPDIINKRRILDKEAAEFMSKKKLSPHEKWMKELIEME